MQGEVKNEIEALQELHHPNLIQVTDCNVDEYKGKQKAYIALEIAERGTIFDIVANHSAFSEDIARYYFK